MRKSPPLTSANKSMYTIFKTELDEDMMKHYAAPGLNKIVVQ